MAANSGAAIGGGGGAGGVRTPAADGLLAVEYETGSWGCGLAGRRSGKRASTCGTPTEPDDRGAPLCQSPGADVGPLLALAAVGIE
jgi:hypothetical protein